MRHGNLNWLLATDLQDSPGAKEPKITVQKSSKNGWQQMNPNLNSILFAKNMFGTIQVRITRERFNNKRAFYHGMGGNMEFRNAKTCSSGRQCWCPGVSTNFEENFQCGKMKIYSSKTMPQHTDHHQLKVFFRKLRCDGDSWLATTFSWPKHHREYVENCQRPDTKPQLQQFGWTMGGGGNWILRYKW